MTEDDLRKIKRFLRAITCSIGLHWEWPDCPRCETFRCAWCLRRVSWNFGGSDDMPEACDHCWAEAHERQSPGWIVSISTEVST